MNSRRPVLSKIIETLRVAYGPMTPAQIAAVIGKSPGNVRSTLCKAAKRGDVVHTGYGAFRHPDRPDLEPDAWTPKPEDAPFRIPGQRFDKRNRPRHDRRDAILDLLRRAKAPLAPHTISKALAADAGVVSQMLRKQLRDGEIVKAGRGLYTERQHDHDGR